MSQAVPTGSSLPASFVNTPNNPYADKIAAAGGQQAASQQAADSFLGDLKPQTLDAPKPQPAPQPQPQPAPQQTQQAAPQPAPKPSYDEAVIRQMEAERQQLRAQLQAQAQQIQAQTQQMEQYRRDADELAALRQQAQLQASLSPEAFEGLNSVDPEDAQRISMAVLNATGQSFHNMKKELEAQNQQLRDFAARSQQALQQERSQQYIKEILKVHPDFYQLQNSDEYRQYMSGRDGLSSKTRDQRAAEEFMAGNTAYVIDVLDHIKGQKPQVQDIMTVAPVQGATAAAVPPVQDGGASRYQTLRDLNTAYSMRQIGHGEYIAELAKLRAANAAPMA